MESISIGFEPNFPIDNNQTIMTREQDLPNLDNPASLNMDSRRLRTIEEPTYVMLWKAASILLTFLVTLCPLDFKYWVHGA
uniref:Uncharacterized protein n=1 Tax=Aedes aegypti TaxID=7159 RepID=A0A6E8PJ98_AEDAE